MKSVLMSIQPYWVFLIIAKTMGWHINKEKTIEVRKTIPKVENWDEVAKIYCSKDKKSFAQIPKEYQPLMERFLGKVIGEFVCDKIYDIGYDYFHPVGYEVSMGELSREELYKKSCLSFNQIDDYLEMELGYGWHISNLVIYDKPRELREFSSASSVFTFDDNGKIVYSGMKRPPQSWCYVEEREG